MGFRSGFTHILNKHSLLYLDCKKNVMLSGHKPKLDQNNVNLRLRNSLKVNIAN